MRSRKKQIEAQNAQGPFKDAKSTRRFGSGEKGKLGKDSDIAEGLKGNRKMEDLLAHRPV